MNIRLHGTKIFSSLNAIKYQLPIYMPIKGNTMTMVQGTQ